MGTLWQDVRYGIRGFRKSPGFAGAAVFALALGIGANTAIFSIINAVLLNSAPLRALRDPDRLVMIWEKNPLLPAFVAERMPARLKNYLAWNKQARSFEGMAIYSEISVNVAAENDSATRRPELVQAARASSNFFPLLGIRVRLGRNFKPEEMQPGNGKVAIITDDLYRGRFHSDPAILGKTLRADRVEYQIIGVLPPGFKLPGTSGGFDQNRSKIWLPVNIAPGPQQEKQSNYMVFGRLKPGISLNQARAEMSLVARRLQREDPDMNTGFSVNVFSLSDEDVSPELRRSLLILQVAVGFVLLIACANVANLLLTRAVQREREIAVRMALGAGRRRIVRQMLSESVLLSAAGGVAGLLLAVWILRIVSALAPPDTHGFHELRIDPLVLGFTFLVVLASGILFGMAPALHALRQSVNEALGRGARGVGGASNRLRSSLVIAEIALSIVLLIGAGLMIRSLARIMSTDLGFRPDHLVSMRISLPQAKYPKLEQVAAFDDRLLEGVRQLPGVQAVSLTDALPMRSISAASYELEGKPSKPGQERVSDRARVREGYFETLGLRVLRGRTFDRQDVLASPPSVALVNESFARTNWPGQDPIGKVIVYPQANNKKDRYSVIGIVSNEHQFGPDSPAHTEIYLPVRELQSMILLARTAGDPAAMASAIENQVQKMDKEQPVADVSSMDAILHEWTAPRRFNMTVLMNFAGVAVLLAAVGLYSVLAYSVSLRTREIGVRVALGAEPRNVVRLVLGQGLRLIVWGIALGLAGSFALTRFMESILFGISTTDPSTFVFVTGVLVLVSAAAIYLPAKRAARINPIEALRVE